MQIVLTGPATTFRLSPVRRFTTHVLKSAVTVKTISLPSGVELQSLK